MSQNDILAAFRVHLQLYRELGDCSTEDRADDFMIGMTKDGEKTRTTVMDAVPGTPVRGDNAWTLQISDLADTLLTDTHPPRRHDR